jgi:arylsulfatase A
VVFAVVAALCWAGSGEARASERAERPNVVVVLADDLGYGDLACYGHPTVRTPNLDRFAAEGVRFTSCYASAPVCSPSRCGLMTGRTPNRVGIYDWIPFMSPMHVSAGETTLAGLLRDSGYATCHVGKWHLNGLFNLPGQPQPGDLGFEHWFSTQNNALPNHHDPYNFVRDGIPAGPLRGYASELVAAEAIDWLREGRDRAKPFFLFVCFHEPHEPIATAPRFAGLYDFPDDPSRRDYYGNVSQMDDAFGKVMKALDDLKLRDSTFVMFTSDNGPARTRWHNVGSSGPLREFKGHIYEGGIRVPGLVRWPGHAAEGQVCDEPVSGIDLLPTVCRLAGVSPTTNRKLDGADFSPVFDGGDVRRSTPLYWQYNRARSAAKVALRIGDWKVVATLDKPAEVGGDITEEGQQALKTAEPADYELYNLREDLGETTDLSGLEPEKLAEMVSALKTMYREVREESPVWPVWKWPHYEGKRIQWPDYTAKPLPKAKRSS